jgi:hypothetical protein
MGKLRSEATAEIEKCAWVCDYYAEHAKSFLADEPIATDASSPNIAQKRANLVQPIDKMGVPPRTLRKKPNEVARCRSLPQSSCVFPRSPV